VIASLGMYDMPELREANDHYWAAIREELHAGPERLTRDGDLWDIWQSPDTVFAQTCGYPYRVRLHGQVELVGTPDHGLPDCPPGHYCSVLVVRAGDGRDLAGFDGAAFAFNDALSQSGWAAPVGHLLARGVRPGAPVETGAHALSVEAVTEERADIAGVDALTWALLVENRPDLTSGLRVLDRTAPTPALPYITARGRDRRALFSAVSRAIAGLDPQLRARLHLQGLVHIPATEYLALPTPPGPEAF
jgi:ABC-type phosphate/phosphonate transport system substrate-binding protein